MKRLLLLFCLMAGPIFGQMSVAEAKTIIKARYGELPAWKRQQAWKVISGDAAALKTVSKLPVGTAPGWVRAKAFEKYPITSHYDPVVIPESSSSPFHRPAGGSSGGSGGEKYSSSGPVYTGPRGGRYTITKGGNKSYK